ncbi:hypothetical protein EMWEY_00029780 [Eimeria maxima]|uniref:Uncharacterized protein n=1 Tax=Eimeria maxima TaxID=5804 RepID=U6MBC4_EIMMA|nr:hypothetical protein EMWEY_00029780 [Eimeria maxima]CDJ60353.1 hypothetical protein EMWEY_00029780 [Eimeria maxima]
MDDMSRVALLRQSGTTNDMRDLFICRVLELYATYDCVFHFRSTSELCKKQGRWEYAKQAGDLYEGLELSSLAVVKIRYVCRPSEVGNFAKSGPWLVSTMAECLSREGQETGNSATNAACGGDPQTTCAKTKRTL